ncbi:MAG: VOC family protein [Blautia sp.]|nr:VOC family protein [Blautia sp.]
MSLNMGKILHLGIVVRDLEKAVQIYEEELGIGPWEIMDARPFFATKPVNDSHGLNIITAMFKGEGYEIELVCPAGPGVYQDWLDTKGPGLHHIKFESDATYEEIVETGKRVSGRAPYLDVRWEDGRPLVAYADLLQEAGLLLEIGKE